MRFLITGGAGFIGSHLAAELAARGEVRVLDDLSTGRAGNLDGLSVELRRGDITDPETVREAMAGVDHVFHLAAFVSVPDSLRHPAACERVNGLGLVNVLEAAAAAGVRKVFFPSSAAVYGDDPTVPKREEMSAPPRSPYALTKLAGEAWCEWYCRERGLPTVALRFFNVFGPRQDPGGAYAAAVPIFIERALRGEPLTIFGDGGQTRDFIHVRDIVSAIIHVTLAPALHGIFNAGYGQAVTVLELAREIIRLAGTGSRVVHLPERPGDVRHSLAAVDRLAATGFRPAGTLAAGLAETVEWYRERLTVVG